MSIEVFGKKVLIQIYDRSGKVVLSTSELRIDFDIRNLQSFNRAKFSIYNLNNSTIKEINSGDKYVRLYVSLHGSELELVANDFYINNAFTEKKVPNTITNLFCIDKLYKDFTSKELKVKLKEPTLLGLLGSIVSSSREGGVELNLIDFPAEVRDYSFIRPIITNSGIVDDILADIGDQFSFVHHIKGNTLELSYIPLQSNVEVSGQSKRKTITLFTSNMRANPVIGVAQLEVQSNLDPSIECNVLLDTSNLVTASSRFGFNELTVTKDFLESSVAGWSLYSALSVNHIGSTHTKEWTTKVIGIKAARGSHIPTYNWFG